MLCRKCFGVNLILNLFHFTFKYLSEVNSFVESETALIFAKSSEEVVGFLKAFPFLADFHSHPANHRIDAIVQFAIMEDEIDVFDELTDVLVDIQRKLLLNGSEVHRLLHDLRVVWNVQFLPVDWFMEYF